MQLAGNAGSLLGHRAMGFRRELIWEVTEQLIARRACRLPPAKADLVGRMFLLAGDRHAAAEPDRHDRDSSARET